MTLGSIGKLIAVAWFNLHWVLGGAVANSSETFQSLSLAQGLSQSRVTAMIQDSEGYMWFGTQIGLNRFDGYEIISYFHDPLDRLTLPGNSVSTLLVDTMENMWVGTTHTGLAKYHKDSQSFSRVQYPDSPTNAQKMIYSIVEDNDQRLWVGTGGGVFIYDLNKDSFIKASVKYPNLSKYNNSTIRSLFCDETGHVWIGADFMDMGVFDVQNSVLLQATLKQNSSTEVNQYRYHQLRHHSDGRLILATNKGLWSQVEDTLQFQPITVMSKNMASGSALTARALLLGKTGSLWVGAEEGMYQLAEHGGELVLTSTNKFNGKNIKTDSVQSLYQSTDGIIWIGTAGGGVSKHYLQNRFKLFSTASNSTYPLSAASVWSIAEDQQDNLWVGTKNGGLNKINFKTETVEYFKHDPEDENSLSNNTIRSILVAESGDLWIGTDGGLNHLKKDASQFSRYLHKKSVKTSISSDLIRPVLQTRDGMIWIGTTGAGLNRMDPSNPGVFTSYRYDTLKPNSLPSNDIYQLYEDQQSRLWVATLGGGLSYFDRVNNQFTTFSNNPDDTTSLSGNNVLSLTEGQGQSIWIGTTNGLNRLDNIEQGQFKRIHMDMNILGIVVYGLLSTDDNSIWLSTNKGISQYIPEQNLFRNYDSLDGLQSNEFNGGAYHKSKQGVLYFGGIEGMNAFKTTDISNQWYSLPSQITEFTIKTKQTGADNTNVTEPAINYSNSDGVYVFDDSLHSLHLEFSSLNYVSPSKVNYKYRMLGYEENWNVTTSEDRVAIYTNLNPGWYHFQVLSSNSDGSWANEATQLAIKIQPPYWQSWWFLSLVMLMALLVLKYVLTYRLKSITRQNENLANLVNTKSQKIIAFEREKIIQKERQRINRDLHDSIGGQLISTIIQLRQGNYDEQEVINQIQDSVKDLKYIMDSMDQAELNLGTIIQFILDKFQKKIETLGMSIRVLADERHLDIAFLPEQAVHIQHIIQEAVVNAVRHSHAQLILIKTEKDGQCLKILIEDDGQGINQSNEPGRGILNMKYRVNKVSGHMQINTHPSFEGTQLVLKLPLTESRD
ncbi:sensor histidine kinase [Marinicella meishanensis]|uniref:sensor histidine kinase n=1 Tax=Marinicella meishanensis TaxID=2873263 RepID=UPI001CBE5CE8|nr:sensor histidine kinase [Marinicella sp. NBU2979]